MIHLGGRTAGDAVDHATILQYVQALGFPICVAIAMGLALWSIGGKLLSKFFEHVDDIVPRLDRIAEANEKVVIQIQKWPSDIVEVVADTVIHRLKDGNPACSFKKEHADLLDRIANRREQRRE